MDRKFTDSDTLQRHELSAIFGDMPDPDYASLLVSVEKDGFIDDVIRLVGDEVLDGWYRYRAAKQLNLLRKLRFRQWNEKEEGDPAAFVLARNIERRHLSAAQRAQIVVSFNARFEHGGDRTQSKLQDCDLKTQAELAEEAGVSKRTISTAVQVEKAGASEAVISGEKTASEVLKKPAAEPRRKVDLANLQVSGIPHASDDLKRLWEKVSTEIPQWKKRDKARCQYESDHIDKASPSMLIAALRQSMFSDEQGGAMAKELKQLLRLMENDTFSFVLRVRQVLKVSEPSEAAPDTEQPVNEVEPDPDGCRQELKRLFNLHGELNKGNMEYRALRSQYNLTDLEIKAIADDVCSRAQKRVQEKHGQLHKDISKFYLENRNLSDVLGLDAFQKNCFGCSSCAIIFSRKPFTG